MEKSNIQLLNETKEKMRKLYEYSFYRQGVYEDDDDTTEGTPASEGVTTNRDFRSSSSSRWRLRRRGTVTTRMPA